MPSDNNPRPAARVYPLDAHMYAIDVAHARGGVQSMRAHAVAGPISRMLAGLFDHLIPGIPVLLISTAFAQEKTAEQQVLVTIIALLALVAITGALNAIFESRRDSNASLGKHLCGLMVISGDGSRPTVRQVVLRNLLRIVDFLPIFYLTGFAVSARCPGQRFGDVAAGTIVVRTQPLADELAILNVPASAYGTSEAGYLLEAWALRHGSLPEHAQQRIAHRLAVYLYVTYPTDDPVLLNLYRLQQYVEFLRRLHADQSAPAEA